MKFTRLKTNGRITIPILLRKKYGLYPGRKVRFEVEQKGIKIIPLVTPKEIKANIGFLGATSQMSGKKGKLLTALMEEKRLEK